MEKPIKKYEAKGMGLFVYGDYSSFLTNSNEIDLAYADFKVIGSCKFEYNNDGVYCYDFAECSTVVFFDEFRRIIEKILII